MLREREDERGGSVGVESGEGVTAIGVRRQENQLAV
jgi:hypothetical protein